MLHIEGFTVIDNLRKDRDDTVRGAGGGLLVYAKKI